MSKNPSAVKKFQVSIRNRRKNKSYKSVIKTLTKKYISNLRTKPQIQNSDEFISELSVLYKKIDKAVIKGVLHKNNGARKKSLIAKALKSLVISNI
uniref:Small ribosomal subunit protein bS20c n=1 Tax=Gracilaria firma TaxID=2510791 RepID=A0A2Z2JNI1_9FLOR|nr:ribosomal protein S20 [Gracilaria changii]ART65224.1 ribosomal protein S20 [Gracilaria changii]